MITDFPEASIVEVFGLIDSHQWRGLQDTHFRMLSSKYKDALDVLLHRESWANAYMRFDVGDVAWVVRVGRPNCKDEILQFNSHHDVILAVDEYREQQRQAP